MPSLAFLVIPRWVATDISPQSGAAILEVDIPTGYYVRKQQLRLYQRLGRIPAQRTRFVSQKVVLNMDYVSKVSFFLVQ